MKEAKKYILFILLPSIFYTNTIAQTSTQYPEIGVWHFLDSAMWGFFEYREVLIKEDSMHFFYHSWIDFNTKYELQNDSTLMLKFIAKSKYPTQLEYNYKLINDSTFQLSRDNYTTVFSKISDPNLGSWKECLFVNKNDPKEDQYLCKGLTNVVKWGFRERYKEWYEKGHPEVKRKPRKKYKLFGKKNGN